MGRLQTVRKMWGHALVLGGRRKNVVGYYKNIGRKNLAVWKKSCKFAHDFDNKPVLRLMKRSAGCSAARERSWFGTRWSQVRILSSRLFIRGCIYVCILFLFYTFPMLSSKFNGRSVSACLYCSFQGYWRRWRFLWVTEEFLSGCPSMSFAVIAMTTFGKIGVRPAWDRWKGGYQKKYR